MKNINSYRVFERNEKQVDEKGTYVLYWMQANRRLSYNFALEYAVALANKLELPLLVYEGLSADYAWNSKRHHKFIVDGMLERRTKLHKFEVASLFVVEKTAAEAKGLVYELAERAAIVVSDEYPVFMTKAINERISPRISKKYVTVDSNGLIPMRLSTKDPYTAYLFRKTMQKHFADAYNHPPQHDPLKLLQVKKPIDVLLNKKLILLHEQMNTRLNQSDAFLDSMSFDYDVEPVILNGSRSEGLQLLHHFLENGLKAYDEERNHPDRKVSSGLSPWLHYGVLSAYEIIHAVIDKDNPTWNTAYLKPNNGKNRGFFNLSTNVESFLDELITWREVGFHYAFHRPDYDQFDSLPTWAKQTMEDHKGDERSYLYDFETLDAAKTHDPIWNAAQLQLKEEGIIHNYLRMLWGKKVIEWSPNYETALKYLIDLNNIYAIDGRDPNSYSGIFWCFGRFDRAWTERSIFGKLRYMASKNTFKKVKMKGYLQKWGQNSLF